MGYATIVSGGSEGRYVITLDYGEATRTAVLAGLSVHAAALAVRVSEAQTRVDEAQALEDAQAARYTAAVEAFIAQHASPVPGAPRPDDSAVKFELHQLRALQLQHNPLRVNLVAAKFERMQALQRIAYWNNIQTTVTRSVWCTDYTEDATPGAVVATMDIPGDDNLIILAPGCRAWAASDGVLSARELMSPEQAFFNAAIFPGWQIDRPTYRWGTVTAVDATGDTLDVSLAAATSSAQSLDINRETALAAVPVDYMGTGSAVFEVGDRVVVKFAGQSWASPSVMGFVDNPRPANWTCFHLDIQGGSTPSALRFESVIPAVMDLLFAGATFEFRLDGGAWFEFGTTSAEGLEHVNDSSNIWRSLYFSSQNGGDLHTTYPDADYPDSPSEIHIRAQRYQDGDMPPNVFVYLGPSFVFGSPPRSGKHTGEWRVKSGAEVLFNVAAEDFGFTGENAGRVKIAARYAVRLIEIPGNPGGTVTKDLDYTLTGETS